MTKHVSQTEIDFDSLSSVETLYCKAQVVQEELRAFQNPYIGNKRKIIADIVVCLEEHGVKYNAVLDLFSGSGLVSIAMKKLGKRVFSNDLLTCSAVNCFAFVANYNTVLSLDDQQYLCSKHEFKDKGEEIEFDQNIVWNYSDYFTQSEMEFLSYYRMNVTRLFGRNWFADRYGIATFNFALAIVYVQNYIMQRCFVGGRLNHGQVLSSLEHRLQHQRNKGLEMKFKDMFHPEPPFNTIVSKGDLAWTCHAYNADALAWLQETLSVWPDANIIDLCYIDPPYGGDQSDYVSMYRFFEEYIHQSGTFDQLSHIRGATDFSGKGGYEENFAQLLKAAKAIPWLAISYNDSSWAPLDQILAIIKQTRGKVIVEKLNYSYNYRDQSRNTKLTQEYLILASRQI